MTEWPEPPQVDVEIIAFGEALKGAVAEVRRYKSEHNLSMKTAIEEAVIVCTPKLRPLFQKTEKDFMACTRANKVRYAEQSK